MAKMSKRARENQALIPSGQLEPADAICATAQSQGADLVVIRKRDTGLSKRFLTTSVLEALVNQCNFAVLSVR